MDFFLAFCLFVVGCAFAALYEFIRRLERGEVNLPIRPAARPNVFYPVEQTSMVSSRNPWSINVSSSQRSVSVQSLIPFSVQCYWDVDLPALETAIQRSNEDEQEFLHRRHSLQCFLSSGCSSQDILMPNAPAGDHRVLSHADTSSPVNCTVVLFILAASPDDAKSEYDAAAVVAHFSVSAVLNDEQRHERLYRLDAQWIMNYHAMETYKLQVLYSAGSPVLSDDGPNADTGSDDRAAQASTSSVDYNGDSPAGSSAACVVCQSAAATEAMLPCRHVALCSNCLTRVHLCPVCRSKIQSHFTVA
ncbi:cell growth regulator with RING finger domain protein 1-like isoform X1 [Sycon ciliatum]|uniref:cell growth regulator with RING finger domain protein 1-like isoform X1 n=1 Tax=Sycon ciliatum TaxID=27933 RepID=UPI0020AA9E9D|eukprot:scpid60811/ scgid0906/ 